MTYLLARVENFARFDGESLTAEPVMGYGQSGETPHEIYNFSVASDGFIYGHLPRSGGGDLSRLGEKVGAKEASGITVVFISNGVLCGYYKNATVFSSTERHPDGLQAGGSDIFCRVRVDPGDAFLIPVDKRNDEIQPKPRGRFPVLYGDESSAWVKWFKTWIGNRKRSFASEKKRRTWTQGVERDSKARKLAIKEYGYKCECCEISYKDKIRAAMFEVHHKVPYAVNFETRPLEISDLAVLCANCHRMIHKMPDVSDINALRTYLECSSPLTHQKS